MNNLSSVLKYLITKNNLTSTSLARKTGIAQPVIYRLLSGETENPQVLTLIPIANYFEISLDQLLGITSLNNQKILNNILLHDITNKISIIKIISSAIADILPKIILGYQKAVAAKLIAASVPKNILSLLQLNIDNLTKTADLIQEKLNKKT